MGGVTAWTAQQTADGGYIVGMSAYPNDTAGRHHTGLVRTDSLGNVRWTTFTTSGYQLGYGCPTTDGGFVVVGYEFDNGGYGVAAAKVGSSGKPLWDTAYFFSGDDSPRAVAATDDNSVVITGTVGIEGYYSQFGLMKLDSAGALCWVRHYWAPDTGTDGGAGRSVQQTPDRGFIVSGKLAAFDTLGIHEHLFLVKTDSLGDTLWTRRWSSWQGRRLDAAMSIRQVHDSGYVFCALTFAGPGPDGMMQMETDSSEEVRSGFTTRSPATSAMLVKTNSRGDIEWARTYPEKFWPWCVRQTHDRGYVLAGYGGDYPTRAYLVRTDSMGEKQWARVFGPSHPWGTATFYWVEQTADRGYVMAGDLYDPEPGRSYAYLVKTDSFGMVQTGLAESAGPDVDARVLELSPNPCAGRLTIWLRMDNGEQARVGIFDIAGRRLRTMVGERSLKAAVSMTWDGTDDTGRLVPAGVYLVRLEVEGKTLTRKLVVQR